MRQRTINNLIEISPQAEGSFLTQAFPTNFHQFYTKKLLTPQESVSDYKEVTAAEKANIINADSQWVEPSEELKATAKAVGATYNYTTGYFEYNTLTDITTEQMRKIIVFGKTANQTPQDNLSGILFQNLLNLEDPEIVDGKYISHTANHELLLTNERYLTSGFISVKPNTTYSFSGSFFYAEYRADKTWIVTNPWSKSAVTSADTAFIRVSLDKGLNEKWVVEGDAPSGAIPEYGVIKESCIPISYTNAIKLYSDNSAKSIEEKLVVTTDKLADYAVTATKLASQSVSINKLAFAESKNLLNVDDEGYVSGVYLVNINGKITLYENPVYDTSSFIHVKEGEAYVYSAENSGNIRFAQFFDKDRNAVGDLLSNVNKMVAPEGAAYIRLTIYVLSKPTAQFEIGETPTAYAPYNPVIPKRCIESGQSDPNRPKPKYIHLPKDIYVAVGRTIELYYSQIVLNAHKWNIQAICNCGQMLERKFRVTGSEKIIGDHKLTLNVYNDDLELVDSHEGTIHIVADNINSGKQILPIGDSLTNNKPWLTELKKLNPNLVTVGTRGIQALKHEGRSGGSAWYYNNTDGTALYTYDAGYFGAGCDAPEFSETASYEAGEYVKKAYAENKFAYYVFKSAHTPGAWNDNEVADLSRTNPFWNYENNTFSINHYKVLHGIDYDVILIWLGTNGINLTPETNKSGALGIKTLVDNIRKDDPTTPIVVVNTLFRPGQNGIGIQSSTDGYVVSSDEFKYRADVKVLLLEQAVYDALKDYDGVYICPVAATLDSANDFYNPASAKQPVNPRIESTDSIYELYPVEGTHPQNAGYMQAADEIYSTLCAIMV